TRQWRLQLSVVDRVLASPIVDGGQTDFPSKDNVEVGVVRETNSSGDLRDALLVFSQQPPKISHGRPASRPAQSHGCSTAANEWPRTNERWCWRRSSSTSTVRTR